MNARPGEIWLADLGLAAKTCPVVIVSREDPDPPRSLDRESVANVQGLGSLPTVRLERKIGRLSVGIMEQLKDALAFALDLERASK